MARGRTARERSPRTGPCLERLPGAAIRHTKAFIQLQAFERAPPNSGSYLTDLSEITIDRRKVAVIDLASLGLPVAVAFLRAGFKVTGFDIDRGRVAESRRGEDRTREVDAETLLGSGLRPTHEAADLRAADSFIVTVPTPIDAALQPDLSALMDASRTWERT